MIKACRFPRWLAGYSLIVSCAIITGGCPVAEDILDIDDDDPPAAVIGGGHRSGTVGSAAAGRTESIGKPAGNTSKSLHAAKADAGAWVLSAGADESPELGDSLPAIALSGHKALFAGGFKNNQATNEAFLYDGMTNTWKTLSGMTVAREAHKMVRLKDGRVLIVGGSGDADPMVSTEFFDPVTEQFTSAPSMNRARSFFALVLLDDGRVLVAGDEFDFAAGTSSAEIFDPATNEFQLIDGSPIDVRAAAKLPDGRVLLVGQSRSRSAALFDPATNEFTTTADMVNVHGVFPTATALSDGRVLVVGGQGDLFATDRTDIFDPTTETFTDGPRMSVNRDRHLALTLPDGLVLLLGGEDNGTIHDNGDLFDPSDDTITQMASRMATGRFDFAGVTLIP